MAAKDRGVWPGDMHVRGHLTADTMSVPGGAVGNEQWDPGNPLSAINQDHQYMPVYAQKHGVAVADERMPLHVANGDGTLVAVYVGVVVKPVGDSEVTVDILKNGTTVLTIVFTVDNTITNFIREAASIDDDDVEAGDVFEVVVDATVGTGTLPQGLFVQAIFRESAEGA